MFNPFFQQMGCWLSKPDIYAGNHGYIISREIAQGGFSIVYLGRDCEDQQKVVIKKVDCHSPEHVKMTRLEASIHKNHGGAHNIIQIMEHSEQKLNTGVVRFYLVFPYRERGSLYDELIERGKTQSFIDPLRVRQLFLQLCNGVRYLHAQQPQIIHRDLKPGNLLLVDENNLEITDFGSAIIGTIVVENAAHGRRLVDDASEHSTMTYRAPELFSCDTGTVLDEGMDNWSVGCILYALCFFKSPFDDVLERGDSVPLAMMNQRITFPKSHIYSEALTLAITKILEPDPAQRLKIDAIIDLIG